jgi:transposase InsO family protein
MELIHNIRGETRNLVHTLRADNGGEYGSNEFQTWLTHKGIQHETSPPHTPQQDGVSERGIRTVAEESRSCLHDCQTPLEP